MKKGDSHIGIKILAIVLLIIGCFGLLIGIPQFFNLFFNNISLIEEAGYPIPFCQVTRVDIKIKSNCINCIAGSDVIVTV